MPSQPQTELEPGSRVVDYDSDGYDYQSFWSNRDYERWVEARILTRLLPRLGRPSWFADFGGGFGRNAVHYLDLAERAVLVDYSLTNLGRANQVLAPEIAAGRIHLLRSDLNRLPLVDSAFDSGMVIRVLHHLTDLQRSLSEMSRTISDRWLIDVPIKHHLLGRARSALHGRYREMSTPDAIVTGESEYPFSTFHLPTVRSWLDQAGFDNHLVASVNNFRRWDQMLPRQMVRPLSPVIYPLELALQRVGRGWWGPSQLLIAARRTPQPVRFRPVPAGIASGFSDLARRLCCPFCRGDLDWAPDLASCPRCSREYRRSGAFWDFASS